MKIVVLGCGNVLAGDDGFGVRVARELANIQLPAGVDVLEAGAPGHALIDLMLDYDAAVIVDAMLGDTPGQLAVFDWRELGTPGRPAWHVHGLGLREALAMAAKCVPGRFPDRISIVVAEITPPENWCEELSPPVEDALVGAMELVNQELSTFLSEV